MKFFIKLLILLLILACASPFFIKGPNGRALMSLDTLKLPNLSIPSIDLGNEIDVFNSVESNGQDDISVYKWRDKNGVVHYSDKQGADKKGKMTKITGITILPSSPEVEDISQEASQSRSIPSPTTVPLGDVSKLIKDAKQIEGKLQERKMQQDQILKNMF